ncbi:glycosyltransferase [Acidobacteriota bacterium]
MMRILEIGKFFPPYMGGIETHLATLVGKLAGEVAFKVVVSRNEWSLLSKRQDINGTPVVRLGCQVRMFSAPFSALLPFYMTGSRYDIIHIHMPNPQPAFFSLLPFVKSNIILTWHSDIVRRQRLSRIIKPLTRRIVSKAKGIIVASNALLEASEILEGQREKCTVIPYGIDETLFVETKEIEKHKEVMRSSLGSPLVLFVGRLVHSMGLEVLVRAMSHIKADLAIIGTGPLEEQLRALAAERSVQGRIHFLGRVDHETLVAAYHLCDLLCYPSVERSEAFGIVQLEAMVCGKPVISTDLPTGVTEVNLDGVTGLVARPGDEADLARAVRLLLGSQQLLDKLGDQAKRRVLESFTSDKMAGKTLKLFKEVAEGNQT